MRWLNKHRRHGQCWTVFSTWFVADIRQWRHVCVKAVEITGNLTVCQIACSYGKQRKLQRHAWNNLWVKSICHSGFPSQRANNVVSCSISRRDQETVEWYGDNWMFLIVIVLCHSRLAYEDEIKNLGRHERIVIIVIVFAILVCLCFLWLLVMPTALLDTPFNKEHSFLCRISRISQRLYRPVIWTKITKAPFRSIITDNKRKNDKNHSDRLSLDSSYKGPGPCLINASWRCRDNFSQLERSFQRKLRCHWLKGLRQRQVVVVRQGPVLQSIDVVFRIGLNKQFNKHSVCRWLETPCLPLKWHHRNASLIWNL